MYSTTPPVPSPTIRSVPPALHFSTDTTVSAPSSELSFAATLIKTGSSSQVVMLSSFASIRGLLGIVTDVEDNSVEVVVDDSHLTSIVTVAVSLLPRESIMVYVYESVPQKSESGV